MPLSLDKSMIKFFYRYDSGAKEFKLIQANKEFSIAIDAISINDNLFKK